MNLRSRRQDGSKLIAWTMVLCLGTALAGCASWTNPFMGVAEWKTVYYEDNDARTPFRGVPQLTAVRRADYGTYIRAVRDGLETHRGELAKFSPTASAPIWATFSACLGSRSPQIFTRTRCIAL